MPYEAPGARIRKTAIRALVHGQPCVVGNEVGIAAKVEQLTRFVDPTTAAATAIDIGEEFTLFVSGTHQVALSGALAAAAVGNRLWIDPDNDIVRLDATPPTTGDLPLGVIDFIDVARTPDVADVNLDALHAFITHA